MCRLMCLYAGPSYCDNAIRMTMMIMIRLSPSQSSTKHDQPIDNWTLKFDNE